MSAKSPNEILEYTSQVSVAKADRGIAKQIVLAIMAGAFIAFASEGSNMAAFNLFANPATYGLGKVLAGAVFGTGLMLVVVAGGELFTGNSLMIVGILDRKIRLSKMLANWFWVYIGNFIGSLLIAYMMNKSNLFNSGAFLLGGQTIKIAVYKTSLSFEAAFFLGVMCNWLVCLAVWVSYASHDVSGKLLACFFIIGLFITSGFEHCVANMYYIPAGILAKANADWATASGLTAEALANLNWGSFLLKNLLPVTLGNIVGGAVMVGVGYWFGLKRVKS
ncbi:formate/nitrite transporter [Bacteroidia bacterium]|nr:formate/nitrite transporter [Bacteroidia bacterium]